MLVGNRFHDLGTSKGMARKHMTNQAAILMLVAASAAAQDICEKGGSGMMFPLFESEWMWPNVRGSHLLESQCAKVVGALGC